MKVNIVRALTWVISSVLNGVFNRPIAGTAIAYLIIKFIAADSQIIICLMNGNVQLHRLL